MIGSVGNGNRIIYEGYKEWKLEDAQTQKRKEKQSDREKTTLDDDAGKNDLTRRDDTSCQ